MSRRIICILSLFLLSLIASCTSTAGEVEKSSATVVLSEETVSSSTPIIQASQTPEPTSTTEPCSISVMITNVEGEPVEGAVLSMQVDSETISEDSNSDGEIKFQVPFPGEYSIDLFSQGYLAHTQQISLVSGDNQIEVSLERDAFGLLPAEILNSEDRLVYIEDFQDGQTDFVKTRGEWTVIEEPDQPGNLLLQSISDDKIALNIARLDITDLRDVVVQYRFKYVEVDISNQENWSGFNFRSYLTLDVAPYYRLYQVIDKEEEWFSPIQVNGFGFRSGAWYTARIEAVGPQLSIYLNDVLMGSANNVREDVIGADEKIINSFNLHAGPGSGVMYFDDIIVIEPAQK